MNWRSHKTILVVDDELNVVLALQKRLGEAGYRVEIATSETDAFRRARMGGIDAITLDVGLRDEIDGLDVASILKRDPETATIPIIFITGRADAEFEARYRACGASYFLSKPYDHAVLIRMLDGILGHDEVAEMQRLSQAKRRQPV
ncbi:MAG: Alkaline phosphatase synthesis transcriptional regulatory protein PhoP [Phycisphaerae bacterium]|nr:Alkaline phosphatase synthesis transcriptional regulatory protein PhoP [Phycisphaerae bacterium]